MTKKDFVITYLDDCDEEQVCEIPAFSLGQALLIFGTECSGQVLNVECTGRVAV